MADYGQSKPTERAKMMFGAAEVTSQMARIHADGNEVMYKTMVADALNGLARGLSDLATGLRATYILLDQVNKKLGR